MNRTAERRLRAKVDSSGGPDACWPFTGGLTSKGYGRFWDGEKYCNAHRAAYALHDPSLDDGEKVRHTCDNPACCNPNHLLKGTQADNIADMVKRGRRGDTRVFGERNGRAKLTRSQVAAIRRGFENGERRSDLARRFAVNWSTVNRITQQVRWTETGPRP